MYACSQQKARQLITTEDDFVRQQSRFDRQARLNLRYTAVEVTEAIYLDYVSSQVMPWSDMEIEALRKIVKNLNLRFTNFKLGLPNKIYLVKTSGQEEGFAAYTRGLDTICLPANMVASIAMAANFGDPLHPAQDLGYLEDVLNHECFHLFSKNNPKRRNALYQTIHYQVTENIVELPNIHWGERGDWTLPQLKITNPDGANLNTYIEMEVPAIPENARSAKVRRALLPVLIATGPYDGGVFFQYIQWQFLAIERDANKQWVVALNDAGQPLCYDSKPLLGQYRSLVGNNFSEEIFHPDEILAQNFVLASQEPALDVLSNLQKSMAGMP